MEEAVEAHRRKQDCIDGAQCKVCKGWVWWPSLHRHLNEQHPEEYKKEMERVKALVHSSVPSVILSGGLS